MAILRFGVGQGVGVDTLVGAPAPEPVVIAVTRVSMSSPTIVEHRTAPTKV